MADELVSLGGMTIGRATYALRRSDYVGGIFTETQHAGRSNLAAGADLSLRPSSTQRLNASFLTTATSDDSSDIHGNAAHAAYNFETRRYEIGGQIEHYDRDFQLDTAFYRRTGFTGSTSYGQVNFYPGGGQSFWIQRITPFFFSNYGRDRIQGGDEYILDAGIRAAAGDQHIFDDLVELGLADGGVTRRMLRPLLP